VTVRNISKKVRRFKFSQPKTNKFKCDFDMQGPIAGGLAIKMNVSFETDGEGDFHDVIEISTEDFLEPYKLYLHALKPSPDIQFEPLVNFRFIPINSTKEEYIEFKNEGRMPGAVRLEYDKKNQDMVVEPSQFTLDPEEIKRIAISLKASEPDFIRKLIEVHVEGQDRVRNIDVNATSVEHHLSIVFEEGGGQKSSLNFGTLYMGEKRDYQAFLVNNGPKAVSFNVKFMQGMRSLDDDYGNDEDAFVSPSQAGRELTERVLTTEPLGGTVAAYSQLPVKFLCRTKKVEKLEGFSDHTKRKKPKVGENAAGAPPSEEKYEIKPEEYAAMAVVEFTDSPNEDLKVQMMARACYPNVKINRQLFQFGDCPSNGRKDFILTLKNKNEDLPMDFKFSKIA
jgi:hypothetical protein